jgi:Raf kinase inhibitor-like YbhB/YbcL family protein
MAFELTSPAFTSGSDVPRQHTCDGADRSPPLAWTAAPSGTKALALVCEDPDAPRGIWVHWVLWSIPASATGLPAGVKAEPTLADGSRQGKNDFGELGYNGPCPPPGAPHRFFWRLKPGATRQELLDAIKGHTLATAELMARYRRS